MLYDEFASSCLFVELEGSMNHQAMLDRPIVRGQQQTGGDPGIPEEIDVPEDVYNLVHSADDHPLLAFVPLCHRRKDRLTLPPVLRVSVGNCACHFEHVSTHIRAVPVPEDRRFHQLRLGRSRMDLS
jgi:hypothetical protein